MIKRIIGILAVIAAVLTLTAAQPAAAASNGEHNQHFACFNGGTTIDLTLTYEVSGVGGPEVNSVFLTGVSWETVPLAKLDRISVFGLNDAIDGGNDVNLYSYGGTAASQNDVPSTHISNELGRIYFFEDNTPGDLSVNFWGGVGDSGAYCQVNHHVA